MTLFWIALLCVCAGAAALLRAYRNLVALDQRCDAAVAEIEAEVAGRHAMLPALVGALRTFSEPDREAIEVVVKAHAAAQRAGTPQAKLFAETQLGEGIHQLVASGKRDARLQALAEFRELEAAFEAAEQRLASARRRLSLATDAYNVALGRFPGTLFAMKLRLAPRAFYDIGAESARLEQAHA